MKNKLVILLLAILAVCQVVDAASVRRRYVPPVPVQWGEAPMMNEVEVVAPREISFVKYGGVIDIRSDYEIDRVDIYTINGTLLSSRRVRDYDTSIETGDFEPGVYIAVTRFTDDAQPAVNKFVK